MISNNGEGIIVSDKFTKGVFLRGYKKNDFKKLIKFKPSKKFFRISGPTEKLLNENIAKLTLKCLKNSVPTEVPGIAFLSGGQSELQATENLNLINKFNDTNFIMSYSFGRALQQSALKFWSKDITKINETQDVFNHRARMCTLAAQGKWTNDLENK